jgi:hypothetical protein
MAERGTYVAPLLQGGGRAWQGERRAEEGMAKPEPMKSFFRITLEMFHV